MSVYARDNFRCRYCGDKVMTKKRDRPKSATLDHLIPKARGGRATFVNFVTACGECNSKKGDMSVKEAGMTLLPVPKLSNPEIKGWYRKVFYDRCMNCDRPSSRWHDKAEYHGGPRKCRTQDSYYLSRHHFETLVLSGKAPLDRFVPQGYTVSLDERNSHDDQRRRPSDGSSATSAQRPGEQA